MNPSYPETTDVDPETLARDPLQDALDPASQAATEPFVGQWHRLVSQTNWEKGRIISLWRAALAASNAPATAYSDESWARQVGAVTSQHVGRLRRVYDRFTETQASYYGLYWSHFLAAMDWDDAELWLEGAARSQWSVSELRRMRAEAMQAAGHEPSAEEELIASGVDDGFTSLVPDEADAEKAREYDSDGVSSTAAEGPDFGDDDEHSESDPDRIRAADSQEDVSQVAQDLSNPFAKLGEIPPDVAEALEQFKLCVIRHRAANWSDFHQSQMLEVVDALRVFASR